MLGAGVNIATEKGILSTITGQYLHRPDLTVTDLTQDQNVTGVGSVTFMFKYTAPQTPDNTTDKIFATGLATNSDGLVGGDAWMWATSFQVYVSGFLTLTCQVTSIL